jgi:hypothetical protein
MKAVAAAGGAGTRPRSRHRDLSEAPGAGRLLRHRRAAMMPRFTVLPLPDTAAPPIAFWLGGTAPRRKELA